MKLKAKTEKPASISNVKTSPPLISSVVKNTELTTKLLIQLVAVAIATPVPIK